MKQDEGLVKYGVQVCPACGSTSVEDKVMFKRADNKGIVSQMMSTCVCGYVLNTVTYPLDGLSKDKKQD